MSKKKKKDFVAFDLETTGVDTAKDRIVQYCFIKIPADGSKWEVKTKKVNPGMPIPEGASDVHGIYDKDVEEANMFSIIAPHILPWIKDCILVHYNGIGFDVPLLATEFERAGFMDHGLYEAEMIDVMVLYRQYRSHSLIAAAKDLCDEDIEDSAHDAEVDVRATMKVLSALMDKQKIGVKEAMSNSFSEDHVDFAGKLKIDEDGDPCYAIGKAKGVKVADDPGFGKWMLKQDFPTQTKKILKQLLK